MINFYGGHIQAICPNCKHSWKETQPEPKPMIRPPQELMDRLKAWRLEQARKERSRLWRVFTNADLERIAHIRPDTAERLAQIKGVGPRRMEKYAQDILLIIEEFLKKEGCSLVSR